MAEGEHKGQTGFRKPFYKGSSPTPKVKALMAWSPSKAPVNNIALRIEFQHEFESDRDMQTI